MHLPPRVTPPSVIWIFSNRILPHHGKMLEMCVLINSSDGLLACWARAALEGLPEPADRSQQQESNLLVWCDCRSATSTCTIPVLLCVSVMSPVRSPIPNAPGAPRQLGAIRFPRQARQNSSGRGSQKKRKAASRPGVGHAAQTRQAQLLLLHRDPGEGGQIAGC